MLNLIISIFNAIQVGKAWVESKHAGGGRRMMAWAGAIMTAAGFTWCISIVLGLVAGALEWLQPEYLELYFNTTYVFLLPPILFSGYAITVNSWANAYRERTLASAGVASYNTFASAYNTYNAVKSYGSALDKMIEGFGKMGKSKDGAQLMIVLLLLMASFGGGIIITYLIINKYAAADEPLPAR